MDSYSNPLEKVGLSNLAIVAPKRLFNMPAFSGLETLDALPEEVLKTETIMTSIKRIASPLKVQQIMFRRKTNHLLISTSL